jgi:hypothetical protein
VLTARDVELAPASDACTRSSGDSRLHVFQVAFARLPNVGPRSTQAWETNARTPSDAVLKLLCIAKRHPKVLFER